MNRALDGEWVIALGNFDGCHLGHQVLLQQLVKSSRAANLRSAVVLFEPHPVEFIRPLIPFRRLSPLRTKVALLLRQGVDRVYLLRFRDSLRNLSWVRFLNDRILPKFCLREIVLGDDFRFGKDRQGGISHIKWHGKENGYRVSIMPKVETSSGEEIRSTQIRQLLANGSFDQADRLLGGNYSIIGRVKHGRKFVQKIGFPSANLVFPRIRLPLSGVYITMAGLSSRVFDAKFAPSRVPALAYIRVEKETKVSSFKSVIEVHILSPYYSKHEGEPLYGRFLELSFLEKIRSSIDFRGNSSLLSQQISKDISVAKKFFLTARAPYEEFK